MLQYVRSEIAIFGQFRMYVFGQISYTLGPSSRLRTHRGSDIATNELGREVERQSTLKVPLPCLAHIYIVTSLVWSPLVTTHIQTSLPTNDPDFFWIGPHPDFGPFVRSFRSDIQQNLGSNTHWDRTYLMPGPKKLRCRT
jgi:hypothetical protein